MTNQGTLSSNQPGNKPNTHGNNNTQKDDDSCSVVCFKHADTGLVGVVRIRQQIFCSLCNSMRGTLLLYCKHILDNNHRDKVKKLCDAKTFTPNTYEQAIHLAFHNNFCYQSEKFHFLYKHSTDEAHSTPQQAKLLAISDAPEPEKMEINTTPPKPTPPANASKQRNIQVTLVFQDKTYTKTGTAVAQIREQLLKDMLADRAADVAALPTDIYYTKKNFAPDHAYYNIANSSVTLSMADEQSQGAAKPQPEPLKNGSMPSAESSGENNGVEQVSAPTAHELASAGNADVDAQPSVDDDVTNVCKDVINGILVDAYSKCDETKREREFLFGLARRRFKKRKASYCDLCSVFLLTEESCTEHRNSTEHLDKLRRYQTDLLPWRRALQESLITGKPMKEIMGAAAYDGYKSTMALHLAPSSVQNHGRFCCAYCELVFPDQWLLEKHLHTPEHRTKQTSTPHKDLVPHFADVIILPNVYKYNGMKDLSEVPNDIKKEHQWTCATRQELDDDTNSFLQKYPFDQLEAATPLTNTKASRRKRGNQLAASGRKPQVNNGPSRGQPGKRGSFHPPGRGQHHSVAVHRGGMEKRSFPSTPVSSKRFRPDLNNSYPGAHRGPAPMRNYEMNHYNSPPAGPFNNGNGRWPSAYHGNQQQQQQQQRHDYFPSSNFDSRPAPPNNSYHNYDNRPAQLMSAGNNYESERQLRFNNGPASGFGAQQSGYNPSFNRAANNLQPMSDYRSDPSPSLLGGPPNRHFPRANMDSGNDYIHPHGNNHHRPGHSQQPLLPSPQPPMMQAQYPNTNSFGSFGGNPNSHPMESSGPPMPSYADYRSTSALSASHAPMSSTQNQNISQARPYENFGRSTFGQAPTTAFGRQSGPSFGSEDAHSRPFGHQNPAEQPSPAPWRGSAGGPNLSRGRGGFRPTNKQPGPTFSYRSNNQGNNASTRGRGAAHNARSFGSQH